eukprot:3739191-Prymnesium_polylepis.1
MERSPPSCLPRRVPLRTYRAPPGAGRGGRGGARSVAFQTRVRKASSPGEGGQRAVSLKTEAASGEHSVPVPPSTQRMHRPAPRLTKLTAPCEPLPHRVPIIVHSGDDTMCIKSHALPRHRCAPTQGTASGGQSHGGMS